MNKTELQVRFNELLDQTQIPVEKRKDLRYIFDTIENYKMLRDFDEFKAILSRLRKFSADERKDMLYSTMKSKVK